MVVDRTGSLKSALTASCAPLPSNRKITSVSVKKMVCRLGGLELLHAESRVLGEKRLRLPTTVGFQASNQDEAIHGGKPTPPATDVKMAAREFMRRASWEMTAAPRGP